MRGGAQPRWARARLAHNRLAHNRSRQAPGPRRRTSVVAPSVTNETLFLYVCVAIVTAVACRCWAHTSRKRKMEEIKCARREAVAAATKRQLEYKRKQETAFEEIEEEIQPGCVVSTAEGERNRPAHGLPQEPMSATKLQAIKQAKIAEDQTVTQLGYNPYKELIVPAAHARMALAVSTQDKNG